MSCRIAVAFVRRQVVENDHVAQLQSRRKLRFDVKIEQLAVHPLPGSACLHAREGARR